MKHLILIAVISLAVDRVFAAPETPVAVTNQVAVQVVEFPESAFLSLLDQNKFDEAETFLTSLDGKEGLAPVAIEYARARLAFGREQYTEALQHLAQISLLHGRDAELTPAAVFLEGQIYKKTGQTNAVAYVAKELTLGWPGSMWSRRAAELKESKTEQGE